MKFSLVTGGNWKISAMAQKAGDLEFAEYLTQDLKFSNFLIFYLEIFTSLPESGFWLLNNGQVPLE
jgi:hypothetical protein